MYGGVLDSAAAKAYRLTINIILRSLRSLMRLKGVDGYFCVGPDKAFYEFDRMRFLYHYANFGVAGNMDSGGTTEPLTRAKLLSFLAPGRVFYDVGAHEGLFSIDVRKHFPTVVIRAFEPFAAALTENLALNEIRDVHVYAVAVGDRAGNISLTSNLRSSNYICAEGANSVPMITLDSVVSQGAEPPDLVKLDIEGFELHALRGFETTLRAHQPLLITEINHCLMRYHPDLREFMGYLTSLNYAPYRLENDLLIALDLMSLPTHLEDLPMSEESNYWWVPPVWKSKIT